MPKQKKLLEAAHLAGIWLCQKMSSSVMKIFVPLITFFKKHIFVTSVRSSKLDEIPDRITTSFNCHCEPEALHRVVLRAKGVAIPF